MNNADSWIFRFLNEKKIEIVLTFKVSRIMLFVNYNINFLFTKTKVYWDEKVD